MAVELKIPTAGESISEVQIGEWLKAEGDYVERDEPVVALETDKASMDLPAPVAGVLKQQVHRAGEIVPVGSVIALIEEGPRPGQVGDAAARTARGGDGDAAQAARSAPQKQREIQPQAREAQRPPAGAPAAEAPPIGPAARRALAEAGLRPEQVEGTGPGGRVLKEDVERAVAAARARPQPPAPAGREPARPEAPPAPAQGVRPEPVRPEAGPARPPAGAAAGPRVPTGYREEEAVPMTMLRRRIAERLVEAKQTMAMLTTFNEVDMSAVNELRARRGEEFEKRLGVKLGLMSFFVKAAIDALKRFPAVNAEIRGSDIVYKNYYDIGIAVSTEAGLIVPVVRDAERLSFAEVEQRIADLARRARERRIAVEELQGGTFTITNGGVFGSLLATPIINPPQSAILGLHAIQERPVARGGEVVIRPMMYVALTYDHRIIDGRESVTFLRRITECVEDPARMLVEI